MRDKQRYAGKGHSPARRLCEYISSLYGGRGEAACRALRNITYALFGIAPAVLLFGVINFVSAAVCAFLGGVGAYGIGSFLRRGIAGAAAAVLLVLLALTLVLLVKAGENTRISARAAALCVRRRGRRRTAGKGCGKFTRRRRVRGRAGRCTVRGGNIRRRIKKGAAHPAGSGRYMRGA